MAEIRVNLNQGRGATLESGISVAQALKILGVATDHQVVAARVDGREVDLTYQLNEDCIISPIPIDTPEGLEILRHSTSHIMAEAVRSLFPGVKVTIGPATESGFYYDFDAPQAFTPEDLPRIEARMQEIIDQDLPFVRQEVTHQEAVQLFSRLGETYKLELLEELTEEQISIYKQGDFIDLCRGPHVPSTGYIPAFKLTSVAGAYWRGDERQPMLQRIYGTAFSSPEELAQYLHYLEEAKRRDHRRLGRELELFIIEEEAGPGMVIYLPKGAMIRYLLEEFERREHLQRGYQLVIGPQMLKLDLWKRSGHFENYREHMYFTEVEGQAYGIKPMNCVAHMLIYKSRIRSYRELPLRYFELGTVQRHEKSGVLHGLTRVRQFTQDDAHILCTPDQVEEEIAGVIDFVAEVMAVFGFQYEVELSTRPEKSIGTDTEWELATQALIKALHARNLPYLVCEGEGAFYGPKIDIKLKDALNRRWQCATIQCDFTLPERFDLNYVGPDGNRHRPVMLHRVILGSLERFLGVLIEHYAGAFPVWLAPVQVILLPVTDRAQDFAAAVADRLQQAGLRVEKDFRNEKLGLKVREAQLQKIPYMIIIGDREVASQTVSVRRLDGTGIKNVVIDELVQRLKREGQIPTTVKQFPDNTGGGYHPEEGKH
ncbi:MAG: threonine--tRNA ligase [Deltaproteobacteria bacterium]|nr:threonine--tRNA ligase [Deltaproteobacteria bacterium]MBW1951697.1 threonine--tRNA ligase [Deltaproteobacteria bacterium]